MTSLLSPTWIRTVALSALVVLGLGLAPAVAHPHRRNNPPGTRGGPGTNWQNPPGSPVGPAALAACAGMIQAGAASGPRHSRPTHVSAWTALTSTAIWPEW